MRRESRARALAVISAAALILLLALAGGCSRLAPPPGAPDAGADAPLERPTNIIFMIGDGMGASHITAARIELGPLNMERLDVGGLSMTFPQKKLVTDSAASGTALATGHKTTNGIISMTPDGKPLKTVLEYAEESGMSTGLVSTCSVTHATPAVFVAHIDDRGKAFEIAEQIAVSGVDVLFGGGRSYFLPESDEHGERADGRNLVEVLRERMPVALSLREFRELPDGDAAAALLADDHPFPATKRQPALSELTGRALEILSKDEDGFFVMVEGSQIDWAGHENHHVWLMDEMEDFDEAVGVVMDFAERDGSTLVIVTADHETGAYAVLDGSLERREVTESNFGSEHHSASMVPVLAFGPGAEALGGIQDNTELGKLLIEYVTR